jgi:hypothetical protein
MVFSELKFRIYLGQKIKTENEKIKHLTNKRLLLENRKKILSKPTHYQAV